MATRLGQDLDLGLEPNLTARLRAMSLTPQNFEELDTKGFTVVRNVVPTHLTAKARELVDSIIGSSPPPAPELGLQKCPAGNEPGSRGQATPWPEPGDERPVIASGNYTHSIHHPIPDADYGFEGLMAALVEPYVHINQQLLRCSDEDAKDLKLMQQFFRRTDLGPEPRHGCTSGARYAPARISRPCDRAAPPCAYE